LDVGMDTIVLEPPPTFKIPALWL